MNYEATSFGIISKPSCLHSKSVSSVHFTAGTSLFVQLFDLVGRLFAAGALLMEISGLCLLFLHSVILGTGSIAICSLVCLLTETSELLNELNARVRELMGQGRTVTQTAERKGDWGNSSPTVTISCSSQRTSTFLSPTTMPNTP